MGELFKVSLLDQGRPADAGRRAPAVGDRRPLLSAAPLATAADHSARRAQRHRPDCQSEAPLSDRSAADRPGPREVVRLSRTVRRRHPGGTVVRNAAVVPGWGRDDGDNWADAGAGLSETHVAGDRLARPPSWLTFWG